MCFPRSSTASNLLPAAAVANATGNTGAAVKKTASTAGTDQGSATPLLPATSISGTTQRKRLSGINL